MRAYLICCLILFSACAHKEKAKEQVMPQQSEDNLPNENTPVSPTKKKKEHSRVRFEKDVQREIKHLEQHPGDTPLQKMLEKEPGPFEKLYWKYHHSASLGYRRDRQKFADPDTKQLINARNTVQLILGSHIEVHHMVFQLRGQYGWMLDGQYNYTSRGDSTYPGGTVFHSNFQLGGGYTADIFMTSGVRIEPYSSKNFAFSFLPSAGYKYSHVKNFAEGKDRNNGLIPLTSPGYIGLSEGTLPKPNQQDWFGPFLEGRVEFRFWEKLNWDLYYQFHWTALRSKSQEALNLFFSDPNFPNTAAIVLSQDKRITYKSRINYGQLGGVYLRYIALSGLNFGFLFEGISLYSTTAGVKTKIKQDHLFPGPSVRTEQLHEERGSIHWVNYQVSLFLGHQW